MKKILLLRVFLCFAISAWAMPEDSVSPKPPLPVQNRPPASSGKNTITVSGTLVAIEEDETGQPMTLAVEMANANHDVDYFAEFCYVAKTGKGNELFKLVNQKVTVTGSVKEDEDGTKIMTVTGFSVPQIQENTKTPQPSLPAR